MRNRNHPKVEQKKSTAVGGTQGLSRDAVDGADPEGLLAAEAPTASPASAIPAMPAAAPAANPAPPPPPPAMPGVAGHASEPPAEATATSPVLPSLLSGEPPDRGSGRPAPPAACVLPTEVSAATASAGAAASSALLPAGGATVPEEGAVDLRAAIRLDYVTVPSP